MGEETAKTNEAPSASPTSTPDSSVPQPASDINADNEQRQQLKEELLEGLGGGLRGVAAATRRLLLPVKKVLTAKGPVVKQSIRAVGENRPLAFASEGAVAGESLIPRVVYYGAWGLSGTAIMADIYTKWDDAPVALRWNTALYWTAFHIPASLVVPAVIIHRIVHTVEHAVQNPTGLARSWSPRAKAGAPVVAALLSIIPVVPLVDHAAEAIMEPTLGAYLGLSFDHHHHVQSNKKED